jgi:hypothetical protein
MKKTSGKRAFSFNGGTRNDKEEGGCAHLAAAAASDPQA